MEINFPELLIINLIDQKNPEYPTRYKRKICPLIIILHMDLHNSTHRTYVEHRIIYRYIILYIALEVYQRQE